MSTPLTISDQDHVISLYFQGTIICGDTRSPTEQELGTLPRMVMTSPHDWDPHNIIFPSCSCQVKDEDNPHDKLMAVENTASTHNLRSFGHSVTHIGTCAHLRDK